MFWAMKFHHQVVSCRIQELWGNVMSKCVRYCGESSLFVLYRMEQIHSSGSRTVVRTVGMVLGKIKQRVWVLIFVVVGWKSTRYSFPV